MGTLINVPEVVKRSELPILPTAQKSEGGLPDLEPLSKIIGQVSDLFEKFLKFKGMLQPQGNNTPTLLGSPAMVGNSPVPQQIQQQETQEKKQEVKQQMIKIELDKEKFKNLLTELIDKQIPKLPEKFKEIKIGEIPTIDSKGLKYSIMKITKENIINLLTEQFHTQLPKLLKYGD